MSIPDPQSIKWPADRAVLLVHGVGCAKPGDYDPLVAQLKSILADQPQKYAIYMFYYDYINEWFSQKTQAGSALDELNAAIHLRFGGSSLGDTVASFVGDVIWPVLSLDARDALRTALFRQLQQIVLDGSAAGIPAPGRHISIIGHSLGCFHLFEALHAAANDPTQQLGPAQGVVFDNVIFMASPVQMIRTVAGDIKAAVPRADQLACLRGDALALPSSDDGFGGKLDSVTRTYSIAGNLDPVAGYLFREQLPWAYMNLPGQISKIDQQQVTSTKEADLQVVFKKALMDHTPVQITPDNPHDWSAYVTRHADDLKTWLP